LDPWKKEGAIAGIISLKRGGKASIKALLARQSFLAIPYRSIHFLSSIYTVELVTL
jgi:hypothetical protein